MKSLLLLLLSLLLAAGGCRALSCYQCSDISGSDLNNEQHPLMQSLNPQVHRCVDFDSDDERFKVTECAEEFSTTCSKAVIGDSVMRGCFDQSQGSTGCSNMGEFTVCVCDGDYCNGAGLTSPPALLLLLLLPATLLARLVTA